MCRYCGSKNIWDDNLNWGCNDCGYSTVGGQPKKKNASRSPALTVGIGEMGVSMPEFRQVARG